MNASARGRRMASPVRLAVAVELDGELDGAWWPHTASVARELPELIEGLSGRLGEITDISVNWSAFAGAPGFDALKQAKMADPERVIGHQRMMMVTGSAASANLLVIPCRTSGALAVMILRRAATLPVLPLDMETQAFATADQIVRAARTESALCAGRLRGVGLTDVAPVDPVMTV